MTDHTFADFSAWALTTIDTKRDVLHGSPRQRERSTMSAPRTV